jgi:hypothetical protein
VAKETARQIYSEGFGETQDLKFLQYYLFHNKEPYLIGYYGAKEGIYEKYLPDFEKMVKSFKWLD